MNKKLAKKIAKEIVAKFDDWSDGDDDFAYDEIHEFFNTQRRGVLTDIIQALRILKEEVV